MIPTVNQFPEFVADQLLMAEDLNNMFGYLEEQERLTRTSMIGIGIVCGLEVKTSTDGTKITITRGTGDTSEGYLIRMEEETFFEYKEFDAVKPKFYDVFVKTSVESSGEIKREQRFPIWELFSKAETDAKPLSMEFLTKKDEEKVVLLFYELLEIDAKNCNPTSCDDKGRDVQVNIRKLLIKKSDAEKILPKEKVDPFVLSDSTGGIRRIETSSGLRNILNLFGLGSISAGAEDLLLRKLMLPDLKLRRFDVPATSLVSTNDIFEAYQRILTKTLVDAVDNALFQLHKVYGSMVRDVVTGAPFANFGSRFAFVYDGTISGNRLLHLQYWYDFFFDIIQAYDELRFIGLRIFAQCCPDPNLFPRHLLLGEAVPPPDQVRSRYRSYFIPSPILNNQAEFYAAFKLLYKRLVLMTTKVEMPAPAVFIKDNIDSNIRITPSKLGCAPLSEKSIPYYYRVNDENGRLFLCWNPELNRRGAADQTLSYNSIFYSSEDFVNNPLRYDIEPYNFFRIEGLVGKNYKNALLAVTTLRNNNRLPFDVVALSASLNDGEIDFSKTECHFHDLEAIYETMKAEVICLFCKMIIYYYAFQPSRDDLGDIKNLTPGLPVLKYCSPGFLFSPKTFGHEFELLYPSIKNLNDINASFFQSAIVGPQMFTLIDFNPTLYRKIVLFYFQKIFEQLGSSVSAFDQSQFDFYFGRLTSIAQFLRKILKNSLITVTEHARQVEIEDEIDQIDALLLACSQKPFDALGAEYKRRVSELAGLRQLNKFIEKHPGIEHKAGVPKGGTFIIVYHERQKEKPVNEITGFNNIIGAANNLKNANDRKLVLGLASGSGSKDAAGNKSVVSLKEIDRISNELVGLGVKSSTISLLKESIALGRTTRVGIFDARINSYTDGVVIADFYLPYLCCSDCPPIHYIITEPNVVLTLSLEKNEFCSSDKNAYTFSASPSGGVVTGENVVKENDKFNFNPSSVNFGDAKEKEIVFTYTFEDKTVTFTIKVYRKPIAAFETKQGNTSNREVIFENKSQFGTLYDWDFGESTDPSDTSNKEQPGSRVYKDEGTYAVTLKVTNGACSDTATKIVNIVPLGAVSINLDRIEYCNEEKGPFNFVVSPPGGTVAGEGVKAASAGNFTFNPSEVALANLDNKTVTFTYTAPDGRTATFNAVVFHRPSPPQYTVDRQGATNTVVFTIAASPFAKSFRWDFGDGQTITTTALTTSHAYFQNGTFNVSVQAINGSCTSERSPAVVNLEPIVVVTKTCLPLNDIIKDFGGLSKVDPNRFPKFTTAMTQFGKIVDFYGQAEAVIAASKEEQLKFFVTTKAEGQLSQWLTETATLFSDFRTLALSLYRILVNTSMLIACLKGDDIGTGNPAMGGVFKLISEHYGVVAGFGQQLDASQKMIVQVMFNDAQEELARIEKNKEKKPIYTDIIKKLIERLKPLFP